MDDPVRPARTALSRGFSISYRDVGTGPTVVLIPGSFGSAAMWHDAGYVTRLMTSRRVLVIDPLGHGASDKPHHPEAYTERDVGADIIAVLDAACVDRAALWGYSRGAWLAAVAAIQAPDRVSALILGGQPLTDQPDADPPWLDHLARGDWEGFWARFIALAPAERQWFEERNDPIAMAAAFTGARLRPRGMELDAVRAPVLAYCGSLDDPQSMIPTAAALGVELSIVDGCDHLDAFRRAELVGPLAIQHLDRHTPPSNS